MTLFCQKSGVKKRENCGEKMNKNIQCIANFSTVQIGISVFKMESTIEVLSNEVLARIFEYLDTNSIKLATLVCHK